MTLSAALFPFGSKTAPPAVRRIEARYARSMPVVVLLGLLGSGFEGLGIGMLIPLLSLIVDRSAAIGYPPLLKHVVDAAIAIAPPRPLLAISAAVMMLAMGKAAVQFVNAVVMARLEGNAGRDIRDALAEKALHLDYDFFLRNDAGRLITIIDTDSWKATEAIRVIFSMAVAMSTVATFAVLLMLANWRLFLLVAVGVAFSRIVQAVLARRLKALGSAVVLTNHLLGERMIQVVRAIRAIRLFGQESRELRAFVADSEAVRTSMLVADRAAAWSMPLIELILLAVILGVLNSADAMRVRLPAIVAFLVLLYRVQGPLLLINQLGLRLAALRGSIDAVEWLLASEPAAIALPRAAAPPDFSRPLRFEGVGFAYDGGGGGSPALIDVGLTIERGAVTALVGRSGSGKSTLVNLLCRLIEPTSGRILLGDSDIAGFDPAAWRRHIALAGQDIELVNGTVAENIAYGRDGASRADVEQAAVMAEAQDFITALPMGYDTMLGAIGFGLSGGQRQRIGLARALLRRPEILILDEATSAVDGLSEETIMRLLTEHRAFGRAIVISHRLETLTTCRAGIELADGRVLFQGPLRDSGWFRDAWARQEGVFADAAGEG